MNTPNSQLPQQRDYVTVVSGLPRSGTSMMMRMLEQGGMPALADQIREADVDNPRGYYEFAAVKRTKNDPSWVASARGMVVKMVYKLLADLPSDFEFRVLYMNRRLTEVLASQDAMLARLGQKVGAMDEEKFIGIFKKEIESSKQWLRDQPNIKSLDVDYNQVLEDPKHPIDTIEQFLDGGLNTQAMAAVVEKSLYRQRC